MRNLEMRLRSANSSKVRGEERGLPGSFFPGSGYFPGIGRAWPDVPLEHFSPVGWDEIPGRDPSDLLRRFDDALDACRGVAVPGTEGGELHVRKEENLQFGRSGIRSGRECVAGEVDELQGDLPQAEPGPVLHFPYVRALSEPEKIREGRPPGFFVLRTAHPGPFGHAVQRAEAGGVGPRWARKIAPSKREL